MPSASLPGVSRRKRSTASSSGRLGRRRARCGAPGWRLHEAAALARVVPDLQVVEPLAAHLQHLALPELRLLRRRSRGGGAQHGAGRCVTMAAASAGRRRRHVAIALRRAWLSSSSSAALRGRLLRRSRCARPVPPPSRLAAMKPPPVPGGAMITCILSESLSAIVFWISSGWRVISAPSRAICSAFDLADLLHAVGLGVGQLLPRIGLAAGLDAARLRVAFGDLDARRLLGLGLELALLDLPLLERQHVLHRFFLRLGRDDLFARGRLGAALSRRTFSASASSSVCFTLLVLQLAACIASSRSRAPRPAGSPCRAGSRRGRSTLPISTARSTMPSAARRGFSSLSIACWISARLVEKISRTV